MCDKIQPQGRIGSAKPLGDWNYKAPVVEGQVFSSAFPYRETLAFANFALNSGIRMRFSVTYSAGQLPWTLRERKRVSDENAHAANERSHLIVSSLLEFLLPDEVTVSTRWETATKWWENASQVKSE